MSQTERLILFLSEHSDDSQKAKAKFEMEATKSELAWSADAGIVSAPKLEAKPDLIVILRGSQEPPAVIPENKIETEHWIVSAPSEVSQAIEQNMGKLIVRLIMKGGRRQPLSISHSNASQTVSAKAAKTDPVRVGLESKGRGGKKVSIISGLSLNESAMEEMCTKLKKACGSGGTSKDGHIEIQGDHRTALMTELQKLGYKPKRTGG